MDERYIFHPAYDGHVHVDFDTTPAIGTEFVGPMGLLARLELKLGLTRNEIPDYEREKLYQEAIAATSLKLFKQSFDLDAANTTKQLLCWRDALVMAGWKGEGESESDLLKELAAIEVKFKALNTEELLSIADRWQIVKENVSALKGKIAITVCCEKEQVHPTIAGILETLDAKFEPLNPAEENDIKAYAFTDAYDAYQTAAVKLNPEKDIIVAQNSKAFNDALLKVGHNPIEATLEDANSSVLQLFKLTLLMFAEPNNFRNIVSYLTTRPCPISHGDKLGEYLLKHCGWGDEKEWEAFIEGLGKDKEGNPLKKKDGTQMYSDEEIDGMKNDFQVFKDFLQDIKDKTQGETIIKIINELYDKTKKYNKDPIVRAQLKNVREFCKHILALLEETHEYTPEEIKKLVDRIFSAGNYKMDSATTESFFTYPSLECVYGTVTDGRVVWVDCYGELLPDYDYDFLSVADINYLNDESITIWKNTEQVAAKLALLSLAAKHAGKEVILFVPQNAQGERVKQSPLLTDLGVKPQDITAACGFELKKTKENVVEFASKPKTDYYPLDKDVTIPQREHESYSSLDLLIQSPFDYVLKYACGLYAPEVDQLEGLSRICGTVAHKTLENLNATHKGDLNKMKGDVKNNLDQCIEDAAKQCGIVLLLPENRFELDKLKQDLKNAFTNLIDILKGNNLEIVGMEMGYSENSSAIVSGNELEAKIDLVLKDEEGKILIFDLKYGKPTYYRKNLEENKALQLDVYKYCVENETNGKKETVRMVGYFNLKEGKLYTRDNSLNTSDNVVVVDKVASNAIPATTNIMDLVKESYNYRFEEFNGEKHHIEEAEGVLAKDKYDKSKTLIASTKLDYCRDGIDKKVALYPLKLKKNNDSEGSEKAENIFSDYKLFKGGSK